MHTSIGRLLAATNPTNYTMKDMLGELSDEETRASSTHIRAIVTNAAHYVADSRIMDLCAGIEFQQTMNAMGKAGIRNLPFDPILVEWTEDHHHTFVRLQSKPLLARFLKPGKSGDIDFLPDICAYVVSYRMHPEVPGEILCASLPIEVPISIVWGNAKDILGKDTLEGNEERAFTVLVDSKVANSAEGDGSFRWRLEYELYVKTAKAMAVAMLMLNTKGVVTERIDTTKLNKARAKGAGKQPPINPYHVVRIGHVYDRSGEAHSVAGSGRHMPVHWRAGHVRNQFHGAGRALRKLIFIAPCLVNFDPLDGIEPPLPKKEVVL